MTWADLIVLAVLVVSAAMAFMRGFVEEVLGVGAWIGAALAGLALQPLVRPLLGGIDPPWVADALAVAGVFLVVLVLLKIVIGFVARLVQDSILGSTDRALGLLFGLVRGAFLLVVTYILAGMVLPGVEKWPAVVRDARSLPLVASGADWVVGKLPPRFQPSVLLPPLRPGPSLEDLVRPPARNRT
jgi:membrane protein required for colicin V production